MYCPNCGNQIANDAHFCNCCGANLRAQHGPHYSSSQPNSEQTGSRMYGFGMALASTIMSYFAIIFAILSILPPLFFVAYGLGIPSLIFGIVSISRYKRCSRENKKKPIATLILGINGLVSAILSLVLAPLYAIIGALAISLW